MRYYSCPICVDNTSVGDPLLFEKTNKKYTSGFLALHLEQDHKKGDLIKYVVMDAEDPDNSYFEDPYIET